MLIKFNEETIKEIYRIGNLDVQGLSEDELYIQFLRKCIKYNEENGELSKSVINKDYENFKEEMADQIVVWFDLANRMNIKSEEINEILTKKIKKWENQVLTSKNKRKPNFVLEQIEKAIYDAKLDLKNSVLFVFQINFDKYEVIDSLEKVRKEGYSLDISCKNGNYQSVIISWRMFLEEEG